MAAQPAPELIEDVFKIFDTDHDNKIGKEFLAPVMQALGKAPTKQVQAALESEIPGAAFDLPQLKKMLAKSTLRAPADLETDMLNCFRALDKEGNCLIHEVELRQMLTTLGDYLLPSEVDVLLKDTPVNRDGFIEYEKFVDKLIHDDPLD
ncbi:essential myosin light chain [Pelomyxa schiedti]|nr:essential myosin light chain [Pelomyxa schiedti]